MNYVRAIGKKAMKQLKRHNHFFRLVLRGAAIVATRPRNDTEQILKRKLKLNVNLKRNIS